MKLFLFADDTIVYLENHEESTTAKILEVISEYSKVIEYKELCKQWTTAIFLCTSNEQLGFEIKQIVTL